MIFSGQVTFTLAIKDYESNVADKCNLAFTLTRNVIEFVRVRLDVAWV